MNEPRLTRKQKRQKALEGQSEANSSLTLKNISPKTENQNIAFKNYYKNKTLFLHGYPGTGKSFLALYFALDSVLRKHEQKKILIVRSAVPSRDIGFMPGNASEKMKNYEAPYVTLCSNLFGRGDAYDILKKKGIIEFVPTSFIRGNEFADSIVIIEEAQNMAANELHAVITRVGENSRLIINGDTGQDDLSSERFKEVSGLREVMKVFQMMDDVAFINFGQDDIVRSKFIKDYIIAMEKVKQGNVRLPKQTEEEPTLPQFLFDNKGISS